MPNDNYLETGARRFRSVDSLTQRQKATAEAFLKRIDGLAQAEAARRERDPERYRDDLLHRHPRNVFVIDGGRGSGKTTLLLTLQHLLSFLHAGERAVPDTETCKCLKDHGLLDRLPLTSPPLVLPVLTPNEMEDGEDTMENVFAQLADFLEQGKRSRAAGASCDPRASRRQGSVPDLDVLYEQLQGEVALGWYFSRDKGIETLSRDSVDYREFVRQRTEQAKHSYTRQQRWRRFVADLLEAHSRSLLVICIDDTDLAPRVSENILHAVRLYLSHPLIAVLLCVDFNDLQHTFEIRTVERHAAALGVLPATEQPRAYLQARKLVDEYLYKILPPAARQSLSLTMGDVDRLFQLAVNGVEESPAGRDSTFRSELETLALGLLPSQLATARDLRLLSLRLEELLVPLSIRELTHLFEGVARHRRGRGKAGAEPDEPLSLDDLFKRTLVEGPSLSELMWSLRDQDLTDPGELIARGQVQFSELIVRRQIQFSWTGGPVELQVARGRFAANSYEFRVVEWLLDRELLRRDLEWSRGLPTNALPKIDDPVQDDFRPASFNPGRWGVRGSYREASLPRSCLYFRDFVEIADILFDRQFLGLPRELDHDWKLDLEALGQRGSYQPQSPRTPNEIASAFRQMGSADSVIRTSYGLPCLWVLVGSLTSEAALTFADFSARIAGLVASRTASDGAAEASVQTDYRDERFLELVRQVQYVLRARWHISRGCDRVVACALRLAGVPSVGPGLELVGVVDRLTNLLETPGGERAATHTDAVRQAVLLAWSVAGVVEEWLASGLEEEDVSAFRQLEGQLRAVSVHFQRLRKDNPFAFLDLPEAAQEQIAADLASVSDRMASLLDEAERLKVPALTADFFALDRVGQIAYLLRLSPLAAEKLLEHTGSHR